MSGVCLTVTAIGKQSLSFDVIRETLAKSTLGSKSAGDRVNLERSLRVGDRLDGHFVQGHVDGTATVERVRASPQEHLVWLRPEASLVPYLIPKGSVCVDGVSLTIAAVEQALFAVAMIPTTLERTTLSSLSASHQVNIETDIITRTIVHHLSETAAGGDVTLRALKEAGFA